MGVAKPQIDLMPWDPDSSEHVERLYQQRIACGWNKEGVEGWQDLQREGKIALYWVILPESDPSRDTKLSMHTSTWPAESTSISDSCMSFGGKPRTPKKMKFIPVGHISLDSKNEDPDEADPSRGIYRISNLYISTALRSAGLGGAALDAIERLATAEPLNAKTLILGAVANEYEGKKEGWDALRAEGKVEAKFSAQDWYARRGYHVSGFKEKGWSETDSNGRVWWIALVRMRKDIKGLIWD